MKERLIIFGQNLVNLTNKNRNVTIKMVRNEYQTWGVPADFLFLIWLAWVDAELNVFSWKDPN